MKYRDIKYKCIKRDTNCIELYMKVDFELSKMKRKRFIIISNIIMIIKS